MKKLRTFAALFVATSAAFFPVLFADSAYADCVTVNQAAAIAAAATPTPQGETATVTTLNTCGGDDVSYQVPVTATISFDGQQYDRVYATTNSVITFGRPDGTYWDYPQTPSISLYSMDWLIIPGYHPDEHFIIQSSDGGFSVNLSARPYGQYGVTDPTNVVITAAINTDGTVAIAYSVTGPTYEGQTRTGVRLNNGDIVTLQQYGVQQVETPPTLAPTPQPSQTPTPQPTSSPEPTPTPTPTPTETPTPEPSSTPTPEPSTSPEPTPEPSPTQTPVVEPSATPTPTPTPSPTNTAPLPEPSPTPSPEPAPRPVQPEPSVPVTPNPVPEPEPQPQTPPTDVVPPTTPTPVEPPSQGETTTPPQDQPSEPEQPSDVPTDATENATDTSSTEPQDTQQPSEPTDTESQEQTTNPTEEPSSDGSDTQDTSQPETTNTEQTNQSLESSEPPTNPNSLPETTPLLPPASALVPRVQVDLPGVLNGGIAFYGTKSQPQVIGEDGTLTPPAPPPGSGLPIPPDAITTFETFIGQPGGTTFNAPDIAVPVEPIEVNIEIPGVGEAAQALANAYVALANIGNDMSPVTRKKAKKILITTVVLGQIAALRRKF